MGLSVHSFGPQLIQYPSPRCHLATNFRATTVSCPGAATVDSAATSGVSCNLLTDFGRSECRVAVSIVDTTEQVVGSSADTVDSDFSILVEHISGSSRSYLDDCFSSDGPSFIAKLSDCRSSTNDVPSNFVDSYLDNCC